MAQLTIRRGDTHTITIAALTAAGAAYPWAGTTVRFTAKRSITDSDDDAVITKTSAADGGITLGADGAGTISILPADTEDLSARVHRFVCDLQVAVNATTVYTLTSRYDLVVEPDVTVTAP